MYGHFKWDQIKTLDQQAMDSLKTSDFYRADGDPRVFSLKEIDEKNGKAQKRWFNFSGETFTKLGYAWEQVFIINTKERDYYQEGTPITEQELTGAPKQVAPAPASTAAVKTVLKPGMLVKSADNPSIYYITQAGLKKAIPSAAVLESYGNAWSQVKIVPQSALDAHETVRAIQGEGSSMVYLLENGQKRWVKTAAAFARLGLVWSKVAEVNQTELYAYPQGDPIE